MKTLAGKIFGIPLLLLLLTMQLEGGTNRGIRVLALENQSASDSTLVRRATGKPGLIDIDVIIGLSFPTGDFSSASGDNAQAGAARRGPAFGVDATYYFSESIGWTTGALFSFNSVDTKVFGLPSDLTVTMNSWRTIWLLTGPRYRMISSSSLVVEAVGEVGLLSGTSPEVSFSFANQPIHQDAASASSIAWSLGVGIEVSERGVFQLRYLKGGPEYAITATNGSATLTSTGLQPTGMWCFVIGMRL